ncbi:MAG: cytidine/deoxycytidylate deaminase family protein [Thermodesulfobacteriota bacterium]|nr:cytidine/deoxycytidylate deaminase family protein [Thermodesulfobacteriota bacterium]
MPEIPDKLLMIENKQKRGRPSWQEYFISITKLVAERSTCIRRQVGAILIKDRRVLATGYNGAPSGLSHCSEVGCLREKENIPSGEKHELCRGLHAEQNTIIQAAFHGVSVRNGIIYTTNMPCAICLKMILNAGIKRVYYLDGYPDKLSKSIIKESGLEVIKIE